MEEALKLFGMERAQHFGWQDTYVYTKVCTVLCVRVHSVCVYEAHCVAALWWWITQRSTHTSYQYIIGVNLPLTGNG